MPIAIDPPHRLDQANEVLIPPGLPWVDVGPTPSPTKPRDPPTPFGTPDLDGQRVFVYRNLIRQTFSIRDLASGQVTDADEVWLTDATFAVSQAGRLKALREQRRTIHAGIVGTFRLHPPGGLRCEAAVRYNPRRDIDFLDEEGRAVHKATVVHLVNGLVLIPRQVRWL